MNIIEAIEHEQLLKPVFPKGLKSWRVWLIILKAAYGLSLTRSERRIFKRVTGRKRAPKGQVRVLIIIAGRRSGKTFIQGIISTFHGLFFDYRPHLAAGERGIVAILAKDRAQCRTGFNYIRGILHSNPSFEACITNETRERLELNTRIDVEIMTASAASVRGRTFVHVICDESAHWDSEGVNPDREIIEAGLKPALITIPNSMLVLITTPRARSGVVWDYHKNFWGVDSDEVLVVQAESLLLNPTLDKQFIKGELKKDPALAQAEWLGLFRSDIESYISREVVESCVVPGRYELPFIRGAQFAAFCDPSGGSGKDSMTLAIGFVERDGRKILACLREVKPPFSPDQVTADFSQTLKTFHISTVFGDRFGGEWPRERFQQYGINYQVGDKVKSDLYKEMLPDLNAGQVELLDHPKLINQIANLERRVARGGRDSIDHMPGQHDDLSNSLAGLCYILPGVPMGDGRVDVAPSMTSAEYGNFSSPAGDYFGRDRPSEWGGGGSATGGGDW